MLEQIHNFNYPCQLVNCSMTVYFMLPPNKCLTVHYTGVYYFICLWNSSNNLSHFGTCYAHTCLNRVWWWLLWTKLRSDVWSVPRWSNLQQVQWTLPIMLKRKTASTLPAGYVFCEKYNLSYFIQIKNQLQSLFVLNYYVFRARMRIVTYLRRRLMEFIYLYN